MVRYDLLLKNGHVVDPGQQLNGKLDVGIKDGVIAAVQETLPAEDAEHMIDVEGKYVFPGFIDYHAHVYWGGTPLGVDPELVAAGSGVTTWVDAGSTGAANFAGLRQHVIERTSVRVVPFLNISYIGLVSGGRLDLRFGELFDHRLLDASACIETIAANEDAIAGIKVRVGHTSTGPHSMDSLRAVRCVADATGLPVMVHVSDSPPPMLEEVLPYLQEGDVVTHCFTPLLMRILDRRGRVKASVREARERGVLFDVGHGVGSFSFDVAERAINDDFMPDMISTDLHIVNIEGPVFDMPTTMSKFLCLGLSLEEVILRSTTIPARHLRILDGVGALAKGCAADVAIGTLETEPMTLGDSTGESRKHDKQLRITQTILGGKVLPSGDTTRIFGRTSTRFPYLDPNLTRPWYFAPKRTAGGPARHGP